MSHISGKIALVTGASSGLGAAMARVLGEAGASVVIAARRKDRLDALAAEMGGDTLAVECDVTDEAAVERMFAAAIDRFGRLDILVNNAGMADHTPTDELSLDRWHEIIETNLTSAFLCARAALRIMKKQGRGRILNVGSLSGLVPRGDTVAYAATKAGMIGLNHSLAIDGRAHGIASSIFHPGIVGTELRRSTGPFDPLMRMGAETTARAMLAMIDLPDHVNFVDGTMLPVAMPFLGRG
jgi:NAD(P)-dependent dehydrogenase (short-subunit alcohol dehydrogenase family)